MSNSLNRPVPPWVLRLLQRVGAAIQRADDRDFARTLDTFVRAVAPDDEALQATLRFLATAQCEMEQAERRERLRQESYDMGLTHDLDDTKEADHE
ncbi:MAG TPA: hypothetical protein VMV29_22360 [Ktedonobacterales bacterium]|nr:hypothetical protein [Ktedonobacterales bacterium]